MRRVIFFVFFILSTLTLFGQQYQGYITSVIDGDTYVFQTEDGSLKIRSEGIDTPEHDQPFGEEATEFMKKYLYLDAKLLTNGVDRYGRTIGTLIIDGIDINNKLLEVGLAWFYADYSKNEIYRNSENLARQKNIGLWNSTDPIAPWDWRKKIPSGPTIKLKHSEVIICTSENSYSYHSGYCIGLRRCKSEFQKVTINTAEGMGRSPCKICYK